MELSWLHNVGSYHMLSTSEGGLLLANSHGCNMVEAEPDSLEVIHFCTGGLQTLGVLADSEYRTYGG